MTLGRAQILFIRLDSPGIVKPKIVTAVSWRANVFSGTVLWLSTFTYNVL